MSKGLQPGDKLPQRRSRLKKYPPLTRAQQALVQDHLWVAGRLAQSAKAITGGFTGCYTREDLESVGLFALCVAASRYDPKLGWKFSTFAWNTCRGWIQHALRDNSRIVKVPRWIPDIRDDVKKLVKEGYTYSEVAEKLGLDEKQVIMCEESWQAIHESYDHTLDDYRPKEFIYEIDEIRTHLGVDLLKKIGDLTDKQIQTLLLHVEGELESEEERVEAEELLSVIKKAIELG